MTTTTLVYFGERFSDGSCGWLGTFMEESTGRGIEWTVVQALLRNGDSVVIRQPTADEQGLAESALAIFKFKGGKYTAAVIAPGEIDQ